jgi:hypothetical protein
MLIGGISGVGGFSDLVGAILARPGDDPTGTGKSFGVPAPAATPRHWSGDRDCFERRHVECPVRYEPVKRFDLFEDTYKLVREVHDPVIEHGPTPTTPSPAGGIGERRTDVPRLGDVSPVEARAIERVVRAVYQVPVPMTRGITMDVLA